MPRFGKDLIATCKCTWLFYFAPDNVCRCAFYLSGYVNKQNCRYWNAKNPRIIHELPLHPQKLLHVLCGVMCKRIIGHYLFRNEIGETACYWSHI